MAAATSDTIRAPLSAHGEQNSSGAAGGAANVTAGTESSHDKLNDLMASVVTRDNLRQAYARVKRNKGAPGIDGMTVDQVKDYLKAHWPKHRAELLTGTYRPQPVRKVEIPKPGGGRRMLGIPTVLDRLIQQALHQVLSRQFEPSFSDASYGFRPGRNAGQAVQQARDYVEQGYGWVVDIDLEKFFDQVNHDLLMARVARVVTDKAVLRLVRRYLSAGMFEGGLTQARKAGTPQGGPLSPLLSNILLTDLDRELERRGHRFCRYADDCNIYVRSEAAGQRVLASITRYLERDLKLRVNRDKSGVGRPWERKFLGYRVVSTRRHGIRLSASPEAVKRFKGDLRTVFRRGRGRRLYDTIAELNPKLRGWMGYFRHEWSHDTLRRLDGWIRRHLRKILWRQWKTPVTRRRMLIRLGVNPVEAKLSTGNTRGVWWNAGASHMNRALPKRAFKRLGLVNLVDYWRQLALFT